jgi:N-acetylmuramoyl-L-alanine amidase
MIRILFVAAFAAVSLAGCASAPPGPETRTGESIPVPGTPEARRTPALPPIPAVDGPLSLEIGYPPEGAAIAVRDSNFIFGSTGSGRARLTINDHAVLVAANGGFLAFLPVSPDGAYRLRATRDGETATLEHGIRVPDPAPPPTGARILSPYPTGAWAVRTGEVVEFGFRAPPGGSAAVVLPDGRRVPLVAVDDAGRAQAGDEFRTEAAGGDAARPALVRYAAIMPVQTPVESSDTAVARPRIGSLSPPVPTGEAGGAATGPRSATARAAIFEFVLGADTARSPLPLNLALLPPDLPRVGVATPPTDAAHDWTVRGRNDTGGPFHYFWPAGTRLTITGQRGGMYRVLLAGNRGAWVPVSDVRVLPERTPPAGGPVFSARFNPEPDWIDLRIPVPARMPFQVIEEDRRLHVDVFGAVSQANFFQYGGLDPLVTYAEWSHPADSVFRVSVELAEPIWGYHTFFDAAGALVLRIRRPPVTEPAAPLRGLLIAVDPGHGGADNTTRGPTGLTEADANLAIALRLRERLERAGARVVMTRVTDTTVALGDRPRMAADSGAHLLVSVHNNAFPDGVNPWTNNGTSVYYYHPRAADLARAMQRELLDELGLRDIGYGRADLALARPTWMPAVLTETMFMMVPEQEAALRDPAVQDRIAAAHVRALEAFVRGRRP